MFLYIRGRGSGCPLGLQLPCSRSSSAISDGEGGCERWKIFGKITLTDGSVPEVEMELSTLKHGRRGREVCAASITGLESAVWFKILILDTICLDLETKCILWTNCCIDKCPERRKSHQPFTRCQHSHEWYLEQQQDSMTAGRDLERGLDIARDILSGNHDNEHQDVLLLLHVYVLPVIRLHAEDRRHVSSALDNQIQVLSELDTAIDKMTSERHDIKKTMKDWRQDICSQLKDEKCIASCNVQFLQLLHQHLQNDLRNAYVELDSCQERVDQCKGSLTKKEGSQYISDLVEARKSRDRVADYINKALFVMEEVHLILSVTSLPERNELTDQHRAYIQIQEECKRHSKELHDLQRKKLLATSVREALVSTESELKQGRETTGIDISSDGLVRSTDVLGPNQLPDAWQTLPSKVSEALEKNKALSELHHEFSLQVVNQCRDEIKGQPVIRRLRPRLDVSSSWRRLAKKHSNSGSGRHHNHHHDSQNGERASTGAKVRRSTRYSMKEKRPTAHFQAVTEELKRSINHHFNEVTKLLAHQLGLLFAHSRSDLWSCYERAFFPGKISEILKLYVYAYEKETGHLQNVLPTSNLTDMQLDDEWILNILGLYAPTFNIHDDVEVGQEVLDMSVIHATLDDEIIGGTDSKTLEEEPLSSTLSDALKDRLNIDDIRERLESGVEIDLPEDRLRRVTSAHHKTASRQSWRNTKIIDFRWVTVPINLEDERSLSGSEPCIVQKQLEEEERPFLVKEHEVASRHQSFPEGKLRWELAQQYSQHRALKQEQEQEQEQEQPGLGLLKGLERAHPLLKKEVSHLEDHIGDDSGVFNDHHDDGNLQSEKEDLNSNIRDDPEPGRHVQGKSEADEGAATRQSRDSELTGSSETPSEDRISIPQVSISSACTSDSASDVEKMSIASSGHEPENNVMIHLDDGEVRLDRELSRRCREKPAISEFLKRFSQAYHYFRVVLEESVPTSKLQWLLRCLKEVNSVAEKQASLISCGKQRMLSGDDLLTSLILFLIHGDPGEVTAFYPQLKFLEDFLPDFLDKGEVGFAVIQFESAYSYILRIEKNRQNSLLVP